MNKMPTPDMRKPWCYTVREGDFDENGYWPSMVVTDDPALYPMTGQGECALPWYWGKTLKEAQATALECNLKMGLTTDKIEVIVDSSISASLKRE